MGIALGVVGAVVASMIVYFIMEAVTSGAAKKAQPILDALASGGQPLARQEVDRIFPAVTEVTTKNWPPLRQRFAALALVRDAASIERELAALTGNPLGVAYAGLVGCIGLAWLDRDPAAAAQCARALAAAAQDKAPALARKLVRDWTDALASVTVALAGGDLDAMDNAGPHLSRVVQGQPLTYLIVWEAAARAFELRDEHQKARNVRERLRRFDKMAQQAGLTAVRASRAAGRT